MRKLLEKYIDKIVRQGLAGTDKIIFFGLDAELVCNKAADRDTGELSRVFDLMNINSLLYAEPSEPYLSIIEALTDGVRDRLVPSDCETRTFFHDIPVIDELDADSISDALSRRKAAIIRSRKGIISYGTVGPEQAFVSFSSTCFSTYVKYFSDVLFHIDDCIRIKVPVNEKFLRHYQKIVDEALIAVKARDVITCRVPRSIGEVRDEMIRAGKILVEDGLIDSYFGNISYIYGEDIFISQTGSSMDELAGSIDVVPLDGSSSAGITASSELSAHKGIYENTGMRAILHGHPKFTVIMSMSCRNQECDLSTCYTTCLIPRNLGGFPVVSGDIGTGRTGLAATVPEAMRGHEGVIVFGHGIFATGENSFTRPLELIRKVEDECRRLYRLRISELMRLL